MSIFNARVMVVCFGLLGLVAGCGAEVKQARENPVTETQAPPVVEEGVFTGNYLLQASFPEGAPKPGKKSLVRFSILKEGTTGVLKGEEIKVEHEKLIHAFILDKGFLQYVHEHPVEVSPGIWEMPFQLDVAGEFGLWLQVRPLAATKTQTLKFDFKALNFEGEVVPQKPVQEVVKLFDRSGDYEVTLSFPSGEPVQHGNTELTFSIMKNGKAITGDMLDKYLDAKVHLTGISGDHQEFVHKHPGHEVPGAEPPPEPPTTDKDLTMKLHFMQEGFYGLFAQFQHEGQVQTVRFGIDVKAHE